MMNKNELNQPEVKEKPLDEEMLERVSGGEKNLTEEELLEVMKQMSEWVPEEDMYPSLNDLINR